MTAFRDAASAVTGFFVTNITVPVPAGVVDGDLMIAFINLGPVSLGSAPAGWTHVTGSPQFTEGGALEDNYFVVMTKIASSEPANYTWSRSASNLEQLGGAIVAFSDATETLDFVNFTSHTDAHTASTPGEYTGTDTNAAMYVTGLSVPGYGAGSTSYVLPSAGFTEHVDILTGGNAHVQVQSSSSTAAGAVSVSLELTGSQAAISHAGVILGIGSRPAVISVPDITLQAVEILAKDTLLVSFTEPLAFSAVNFSADSYTIDGLSIRSVLAPIDGSVFSDVILVTDALTVGQSYTLSAVDIESASGSAFDPGIVITFTGRRTKLDKVLTTTQTMYDTSPQATVRQIMSAIHREDDNIGGSKDE